MKPIRTSRLILRDFVEEDWHAVHAYRSDSEVMRYMGIEPDTDSATHEELAKYLETQSEQPRSCICATANVASIRVLEKLGITREGLRRQQVRDGDGWRDTRDYASLVGQWRNAG